MQYRRRKKCLQNPGQIQMFRDFAFKKTLPLSTAQPFLPTTPDTILPIIPD